VIERPSRSAPFKDSIAVWAAESAPYSTNPNPRDCPVARSLTTVADRT
jgi:hypothetical protein